MRRHRIRRKSKQSEIIIISSICLLFIITAGYAAFSSNINITAKGNIMEKPITTEELKEKVVTTGDGLYADSYEPGRYIYKGANPNNYIIFSGEKWRIISVEADGTIKIMRSESIGNIPWDTSNINDWTRPATLNTYLNEEYLLTLTDASKVVLHSWSIGAVTTNNNDLSAEIADENAATWTGNVGLITVSEYLRANTNIEQCGTFSINNKNHTNCLISNWMYNIVSSNAYLWTISKENSIYTASVFAITGPSYASYIDKLGPSKSSAYEGGIGVIPVLYLSSDITLSGNGTEDDPYVIK